MCQLPSKFPLDENHMPVAKSVENRDQTMYCSESCLKGKSSCLHQTKIHHVIVNAKIRNLAHADPKVYYAGCFQCREVCTVKVVANSRTAHEGPSPVRTRLASVEYLSQESGPHLKGMLRKGKDKLVLKPADISFA